MSSCIILLFRGLAKSTFAVTRPVRADVQSGNVPVPTRRISLAAGLGVGLEVASPFKSVADL